MTATGVQVLRHLQPLIGLRLAMARRSAAMRNFHFGTLRSQAGSAVGEWALHLHCPWRVAGPAGLVTGRMDVWEPLQETLDFDWNQWDYDRDGNLQDQRLSQWLGNYDDRADALVNNTSKLVVQTIQADHCGGATICLSGGYELIIFPAGLVGEDWRIFRPGTDEPHFVISGGQVLP
jgi:hypothetical protein